MSHTPCDHFCYSCTAISKSILLLLVQKENLLKSNHIATMYENVIMKQSFFVQLNAQIKFCMF